LDAWPASALAPWASDSAGPGELNYGMQDGDLALEGLIHQVMGFVPGGANVKLRIVQQLLRGSKGLRYSSFGPSGEEWNQRSELFRGDARVNVARSSSQQGYPAQLRRVYLVQRVMVGVDVDIRPIAQIKRRYRNGGRIIVVVVAAGRVRCHVRKKLVARPLAAGAGFHNAIVRRRITRRVSTGCAANNIQKRGAHVGDKTGQRPWGAGDVKHRFIFERVAANHIHVDVGAQLLLYVGVGGQERHSALHLRPPDEAQSAFRAWQLP
jgi:hypothetical protein